MTVDCRLVDADPTTCNNKTFYSFPCIKFLLRYRCRIVCVVAAVVADTATSVLYGHIHSHMTIATINIDVVVVTATVDTVTVVVVIVVVVVVVAGVVVTA